MSLSREDLFRLAALAKLELREDEIASLGKELDAILKYVDRLQAIDTSTVEPWTMAARADGWREDIADACDDVTREYVLGNFPDRSRDFLKVPAVFEKPKGTG